MLRRVPLSVIEEPARAVEGYGVPRLSRNLLGFCAARLHELVAKTALGIDPGEQPRWG